MKLFLCGFSGAGKTTLGDKLSKDPDFQVFDLDEEIYNRMGSGYDHLGGYIEEIGMEEFRHDELDMLKLLGQNFKDDYLIILGGGALSSPNLRAAITKLGGKIIYLQASFDDCWQRIKETTDRPLVKKGEDYMRNLYEQRLPEYENCDLVLTDEQAAQILEVKGLLSLLN